MIRLCTVETISSCRYLLSWCIFLCSVFIMSEANATTITPPVTAVCSGASSLTMTVTMALTLMGLSATLGQHDKVLPPPMTLRDTRGVSGLATVLQQQPQSKMPSQTYTNYAMGPLQVSFFFTLEPLTDLLIYVGVCYGVCFLPSRYDSGCHIHQLGLNHWSLLHCSPLEHINCRHMCILVVVIS